MNKSELGQIKKIIKEIELLKRQIEDAEFHVSPSMVTDSVKGSSKYFPYAPRVFPVEGIDYSGYDKKVKRYKKQLQDRIDELMDRVEEAQKYIETVEDSEVRMILQCRYINGLTWESLETVTGIPLTTAKRKFRQWRDF